jgi:hypothetical protein
MRITIEKRPDGGGVLRGNWNHGSVTWQKQTRHAAHFAIEHRVGLISEAGASGAWATAEELTEHARAGGFALPPGLISETPSQIWQRFCERRTEWSGVPPGGSLTLDWPQ